ncbi:MAG: bifunctional tetrahydrofolate synthase/dihydrofolate synthase [Gammaproteobacteria bacterium]|nr:bifunctional tetrahydrofolate synthase/dihydrofolate synthase [Gammaproteobacteria bacterium]
MTTPSRQSSLSEWIDWLLKLHAEEIDLGLDRISQVAKQMDLTRPAPMVISVAGTNGKGSSVAMLVAILKAAGYQVGAYTSPHILKFNERIQLNGCSVSDQIIVDAFVAIEAARGQIKLTYFEFSTLAGLFIFKHSDLEVAVLEVGLGGRLDAVNLVDADAALITAIDIDHIDWLGSDRSVIATEKAGIMRTGAVAVCSDPNPPKSLSRYADKLGVVLQQFKVDFDFELLENNQAWLFKKLKHAGITLPEGLKVIDALPMPALKGDFQVQNAAGVLALLMSVKDALPIKRSDIKRGLMSVKHPGRLESISINSQAWLVDVAHNPQSAEALADYLAQSDSHAAKGTSNRTALFSVLNDKDALPMVKQIAPFISTWVVADLAIPRSTSKQALVQLLLDSGVAQQQIITTPTIDSAVESVLENQDVHHVLVWGSFFTVAQAYEALEKHPANKSTGSKALIDG